MLMDQEELLPGVYLITLPVSKDNRGQFTKTFHPSLFSCLPGNFSIAESYYSVSHQGVIRGMHFQVGSSAHSKLVYCSHGSALDVIVDVRKESPFFNAPISVKLHAEDDKAILVGKGYAHGFLSLADSTIMNYSTTTIYDPCKDMGVLWSSIAFDWPTHQPILSPRDCAHPPITDTSCVFS